MPELNDSKKLTRPKREAMFDAVKDACACYAIASASVEEIDRMNILEADFLAMRRALQALGMPGLNETAPEIPIEVKGSFADLTIFIAVDGNLMIRGVPAEMQMPVVKGDGRIASISAASVLAKVFRDRYMDKLAETYPGYGFEVHAGYGTKAHLDAIRKLGFTPAHRKSFHPKSL
jgi:ribonuclease HII